MNIKQFHEWLRRRSSSVKGFTVTIDGWTFTHADLAVVLMGFVMEHKN